MTNEPGDQDQSEGLPYRLYGSEPRGRQGTEERPYTLYRAAPRGLRARLRGEEDAAIPRPGGPDGGRRGRGAGEPGGPRRRFTPKRVLLGVLVAVVAWLTLSLVLFLISAQMQSGSIPDSAKAALASGSNMVTGTDTVLVIGTDQRPAGSKEPGADTSDAGSRSDTIMLWRIGGGVSRRLSIPRDTVASIPGHGTTKINAAYAYGGPALAIKTIEQFTGIQINHLIIVNLANFPKFIDSIGGIDVSTPRICSDISGGAKNGGFSLYLDPGSHHLNGIQALTLARTRDNKCNPAENDLTREKRQQQILNSIKSRLLSPPTFFRLPWASWYAPQAVRTDMGGFTLMGLFVASELGGSAPTQILKPTGATTLPDGESALTVSPSAVQSAVTKLING
ncbi:MAG: LCP family protein [Solirubrobacterales bacterium]|nr:LCP family protein [Solirubrobacterales bacterium]